MQHHLQPFFEFAGAKVGKEMEAFFKRTGCHPLKNYVPMIGQGFVFCSMFFALRGMANCPVESMKTQVRKNEIAGI